MSQLGVKNISDYHLVDDEAAVTAYKKWRTKLILPSGRSFTHVPGSTATSDGVVTLDATGKGSGKWVSNDTTIPSATNLACYAGTPALVRTANDNTYWKYDASSTLPVNSSWCVDASLGKGSGRWFRQGQVTLNARDYGVLGQGTATSQQDTDGMKAVLVAAALACPTTNGIHSPYNGLVASIYIPTAFILVNDELPISGVVHIYGDGGISYGGTQLQQNVSGKHLFKLTGENTCFYIEKCRLTASGGGTPTGALIYGGVPTSGGYNSVYAKDCWFQGPELYSIQIEKGNDLVIHENTFDGSPRDCIMLGSTANIANELSDVLISDNTFYGVPGTIVKIRNVKNLVFANNRVFPATGARVTAVVDAFTETPLQATNVTITGNTTENCDYLYNSKISGGVVAGNSGTGFQQPAINIGGGGTISGLVCVSNYFSGSWSGNITSTSFPVVAVSAYSTGLTNSIIANNTFINTSGAGTSAIYLNDARSVGTVWGPNAYSGFATPVVATLPMDGTSPYVNAVVTSGVIDVSALLSRVTVINSGATGPITNITGGYQGQIVTIFTNIPIIVNNTATLQTSGGKNVAMLAGETLTFYKLTPTVWIEVGRSAGIDTSLFFIGDTATSGSQYKTDANADLKSGDYTFLDTANMPADPSGVNLWMVSYRRYQANGTTSSFWAHQDAVCLFSDMRYERRHSDQTGTWLPWKRIHSNTWLPVDEAMTLAAGDILYHDGTKITRLPKGTNGQFLKLVSGLPAWSN